MYAFALLDGNNFFVSCERVFNPQLWNRPVVVLSNNDGCVIARSQEAKDLGIPMGQPYFKIQDIIDIHNIKVISSNFELYADMNRRLFAILGRYAPNYEIYSVDEAFFKIGYKNPFELEILGHRIKDVIWQEIGIPVSIGFAPTKTLSKVANHYAKKLSYTKGVMNLCVGSAVQRLYLNHLDVADIWGIGRSYATFLKNHDVETAYQFSQLPAAWVKKHLSVLGLRLHQELNGQPCLKIDDDRTIKKSITVSRSFGIKIKAHEELKKAVAFFVHRVVEKLRTQNSLARGLCLSVTTKSFGTKPQYHNSHISLWDEPTSDTAFFLAQAAQLLNIIYRPGYDYKKASVTVIDIFPDTYNQQNFFDKQPVHRPTQNALMTGLDDLNRRFGRNTVFYGALGLAGARNWQPLPALRSPRYTTRWNEILTIF